MPEVMQKNKDPQRWSVERSVCDVDNALSARTQLALESESLERALTAAQTTERLTEIRYRAGAISLSPWLEPQTVARRNSP